MHHQSKHIPDGIQRRRSRMTIKMTMDMDRDEAADSSTQASALAMYKPLPVEAGAQYTNELFIPLFQPDTWSIFNQTPENAKRLGMSLDNPLVVEGMPTLYTFFFKIPTHPVKNFQRPDGSMGFTSVVCPHKFNEYLDKNLGRKPLFTNPQCAFCEATTKAWGAHNERWEQVERERSIVKKDLNKDGYLKIRKEDAGLAQTYKQAQMFRHQDRNILMTFDHGKFMGTRPTKEGEENVYLPWFGAPKAVIATLKAQYKTAETYGNPAFFDFSNPQGLQVLAVIKDTTQCSGQSMLLTEYSVMTGPVYPYDESWRSYLTNLANMPDPTPLLTILPYAEQRVYASPHQDSYNQPVATPAPQAAPVATPTADPVAAPAPQMTPPPAAQAPAPVAATAPQMTPPPAAQAPAPVASPPAQIPQAAAVPAAPAPQMTPPPVAQAPAPQMTPPPAPAPVATPAPVAAPAFAAVDHNPVDGGDDIDW